MTAYASIMKPVISQLISLHYTINDDVVESDDSEIDALERELKETMYEVFRQK